MVYVQHDHGRRNRTVTLSVVAGILVTVLGLVLSGSLAIRAAEKSAMASKEYSDQEVRDSQDWWDDPNRQQDAKPWGPQDAPQAPQPVPTDAPQQGQSDYRPPTTVKAAEVEAPYTGSENALRGKIFFRVPEGSAECSGTVVHHPTGDMVWTAAHCLHGGKGADFYDRVTFIPGYDGNGRTQAEREPYGRWPARVIAVSRQWEADADPEVDSVASPFDFGAFLVAPQDGKSLEETVGQGADIAFDAPRHLDVQSFGYPGAAPYDGKELYRCDSKTSDFPGTAKGWPKPEMLWMGCTMTSGSSGGGWFAEVGGKTVLVSNISLGITTPGASGASRQTMTGPYLGADAKQLFTQLGE